MTRWAEVDEVPQRYLSCWREAGPVDTWKFVHESRCADGSIWQSIFTLTSHELRNMSQEELDAMIRDRLNPPRKDGVDRWNL